MELMANRVKAAAQGWLVLFDGFIGFSEYVWLTWI
jgi:hypothetical protein